MPLQTAGLLRYGGRLLFTGRSRTCFGGGRPAVRRAPSGNELFRGGCQGGGLYWPDDRFFRRGHLSGLRFFLSGPPLLVLQLLKLAGYFEGRFGYCFLQFFRVLFIQTTQVSLQALG